MSKIPVPPERASPVYHENENCFYKEVVIKAGASFKRIIISPANRAHVNRLKEGFSQDFAF